MNGEPDLCIGGQWRHASDGGTRQIVNPADGSIAAVVDEATADDARDAVAAARAAFDDGAWPATPVAERAALLDRIADLLQRDKEELASLETRDTGKTLVESRIDIDDVTSVFRYYAKLAVSKPTGSSMSGTRPSSVASCASPSGSAYSSHRGTTRCCRCRGRSRLPWPPAAPWSPSPARSRR